MTSAKEFKKRQLEREFSENPKMSVAAFTEKMAAIVAEPDPIEAPARPPDIAQVVQAVKLALEGVSATLAPLLGRVAELEKKLKALEGVSATLGPDGLAAMTSMLSVNQTLMLPIKAIYNSQGIVIGARRVIGDGLDLDRETEQ